MPRGGGVYGPASVLSPGLSTDSVRTPPRREPSGVRCPRDGTGQGRDREEDRAGTGREPGTGQGRAALLALAGACLITGQETEDESGGDGNGLREWLYCAW